MILERTRLSRHRVIWLLLRKDDQNANATGVAAIRDPVLF
jgi:hypothetical protein